MALPLRCAQSQLQGGHLKLIMPSMTVKVGSKTQTSKRYSQVGLAAHRREWQSHSAEKLRLMKNPVEDRPRRAARIEYITCWFLLPEYIRCSTGAALVWRPG